MGLAPEPFVRCPQALGHTDGGVGAFLLLPANQTSVAPMQPYDVIPPGTSSTRVFLGGEMQLPVARDSRGSLGHLEGTLRRPRWGELM